MTAWRYVCSCKATVSVLARRVLRVVLRVACACASQAAWKISGVRLHVSGVHFRVRVRLRLIALAFSFFFVLAWVLCAKREFFAFDRFAEVVGGG